VLSLPEWTLTLVVCCPGLLVLLIGRPVSRAAEVVAFCLALPIMVQVAGVFISTIATAEVAVLAVALWDRRPFERRIDPARVSVGLFTAFCVLSFAYAGDKALGLKGLA